MLDAKNSKNRSLARSPDAVTSDGQEILVRVVRLDIFDWIGDQIDCLNFTLIYTCDKGHYHI